ncbi:MAG TPA: glycerol-3-phosphate dehydrogenase/oxidase [Gemmatimonadales bacterium]|nr:glycerol-3-phosphate dehydrogenase/oxidase [Gemmatimonadales bacterium]
MPREPGARTREIEDGRGRPAREIGHRSSVAQLAAHPADLLVIGGGITGAGIARDAAMRGLRTILVDQYDLGFGTSSRSSRLIHGGLRYLEEGDLKLVFEALRERKVLLTTAPHLVRPLPFVFPVHQGDRVPLWKLWAGIWVYDLLAAFRNVRWHRLLGKRSLLREEPMLRERGLVGGVQYYDAQCDDARLVLATVRAAIRAGALVGNYVAVDDLIRTDGQVRGARIRDTLDGGTAAIHAHVVVNATGPWCDRLRRLEDPAAAPLLRPTKGAHVMVRRERIGNSAAITLTSPIDGRVMFVLPWGDFAYIGTTDTDSDESPDEVRATAEDVIYLLRSANAAFPNARLTEDDVLATWAGLRPLIAPGALVGASQVPREHLIQQGPGGMLTIAGGKLTTYRRMAAELVDRVTELLHELDGRARPPRPPTDTEPLPGGEVADLEPLGQPGLELGLFVETIDYVLRCHGTECAAVFNLVRERRELGRPLADGFPAIEAQVIHAVRRELAQRVDDVLVRRLHAWYEAPEHGARAARRTAELMGEELGWDAARVAAEEARYASMVADATSWRG